MEVSHQNAFSTDIATVLQTLDSSEQGLDQQAVMQRHQRFGPNQLPLAPPTPAWKRFFSQFHNVLIYVLIGSAVLSLFLQHYLDAGVILGVVLVNAIVGFLQEGKAEDALRSIMSMTRSHCMVVRDGVLETVDSMELVPGDVVMLQAGDRVPADMRLFFCKDLRCDESALTGEAQPVSKHLGVLDKSTPLADRLNMTFMGTMVTYGVARGVVTHTALQTQIGKISELVSKVELVQTPLQKQLARFANQLTIVIVIVSVLTMLLGVIARDYAWGQMFQAAIGIAVSSIPEGLPAIVTIALAIGVQRMARNHALVRRLPSVEVLGSVDVICSDKTGTLTANEMTARAVSTLDSDYIIGGEGYKPEGRIEKVLETGKETVSINQKDGFTRACQIAMLCNDARIEQIDDEWTLSGDPTEGALIVLAMKHGLTPKTQSREWPRVDELPFESEKRYMATLHRHANGEILLMAKGAPEQILAFAKQQLGVSGFEPMDLEYWQHQVEAYAKQGMRVMALAMKRYATMPSTLSYAEVEHDLVMVALVGISDPPRPEVIDSIRSCHEAGIRVKMITGDNPVTASAIGEELGFNVQRVMTGSDIDQLNAQQLKREVEDVDVFARASPANKLQLVTALQQERHVVAMTGDGVNDAPALKKADIGVAMGHRGTDAAREAAAFVLTDDNFSTIAQAVREGRTVYDNIVKSIVFILPTSLAEALVIIAAIVLGLLMPVTPAQILWINMVTTVTLALALAFEQSESDIMQRPPRPYGAGLFSKMLLARLFVVGGLGATMVFTLFYFYVQSGVSIEYARTISVNALVMFEMFYLFNCRYLTQSIFRRTFIYGSGATMLACMVVMVLQIAFTYLPVSQHLFGLASISVMDWGVITACAASVMLVVEGEKWLQRKI